MSNSYLLSGVALRLKYNLASTQLVHQHVIDWLRGCSHTEEDGKKNNDCNNRYYQDSFT